MIPASFSAGDGRSLHVTDQTPRKGGQALVYQARLGGQLVAVKVYTGDPAEAALERRILQEIADDDPRASEWLVTVLGSGTVGGRPFIVLPWIDQSLRDWVGGRSLAERVDALHSACEAVARLHRSRRDLSGFRVHRDIKPANLLVAWEGRWVVRLADLGVAKDGDDVSSSTNTGVLTERYAPPEQALPNIQEPRESWDVHALAVTIFWGITGRLPLPAFEATGLLNADGRRLVQLATRVAQGAATAAELAEYDRRRATPAEDLLDLHAAGGWRDEDTAHLRRALEDAGVDDDACVQRLATAMRRALDPDGRRRDNDCRGLMGALRAWSSALGASEGGRREAVVSIDGTLTRTPSRAPTRRGLLALLAGVGGLAVVAMVLGGGAAFTVWRLGEPAEPAPVEEPVVAPVATPVATPIVPAAPEGTPTRAPTPVPTRPTPKSTPKGETIEAPPVVIDTPPPEPTPVEVPAPPPLEDVVIASCPAEGVLVRIDGGAPINPIGFGVKVHNPGGVHQVSWSYEGRTHSAQIDFSTRLPSRLQPRICHRFSEDPVCGSCND